MAIFRVWFVFHHDIELSSYLQVDLRFMCWMEKSLSMVEGTTFSVFHVFFFAQIDSGLKFLKSILIPLVSGLVRLVFKQRVLSSWPCIPILSWSDWLLLVSFWLCLSRAFKLCSSNPNKIRICFQRHEIPLDEASSTRGFQLELRQVDLCKFVE